MSTPLYTENVPPLQLKGATAISDSVLFTVNVQPAGRDTTRLSCCTGKKYGDAGPPHIARVGMVDPAGHCSPTAQLRQEARPGAPLIAENVPTGQSKHVEGLVALRVAL